MKKITHAWIAFMAINRLENGPICNKSLEYSNSLVKYLKDHRDGVIKGAWYPDSMIKDMASSHVMKISPLDTGEFNNFNKLSTNYNCYKLAKNNPLYNTPFTVDKNTNVHHRCNAIAHSIIDNLKMQESEVKGSPVSPNDNHIALLFFMLSHYIADSHMPFHCDARPFSNGKDLHGYIEGVWDDEIKKNYVFDYDNERFLYDPNCMPLLKENTLQEGSLIDTVIKNLNNRKFILSWGKGNNNVEDFINTICKHSYLLSYKLIPKDVDCKNLTTSDFNNLMNTNFKEFNNMVLEDAIDSVAKAWFRIWRRYKKWEKEINE